MPDPDRIRPAEGADERPKYVIINDCDAPQPNMVCQWVPNVGYCYLDRSRAKPRHDGMKGAEATPVEAFGWTWAEDEDGGSWVRFFRSHRPSTATYRDGVPRKWQSRGDYFEYPRLTKSATKAKRIRPAEVARHG